MYFIPLHFFLVERFCLTRLVTKSNNRENRIVGWDSQKRAYIILGQITLGIATAAYLYPTAAKPGTL